MIKEVWEYELVPATTNRWSEIGEWLRKVAQVAKKREEVLDAYGLRSETGNKEMFHAAYLVLTFSSLSERDEFYSKGFSDEMVELMTGAETEHYFTELVSAHYYFTVLA